jgi:UDP-glucose 4-epimerase
MRVLITGGAGFIGSHLAEFLLDRGDAVAVLDDLSTGSLDNLARLKGRRGFSCAVDSVVDERPVARMTEAADEVFHLAAAVGVFKIIENPVETLRINVRGTETVLACAAKKGLPVLIASSSEVYGKSNRVPFSEEDDIVLGPTSKTRWSYACSKLMDEHLALAYYAQRGLPTVIARLFNTVGPRQTGDYGMVIPRLVRQALAREPLTVYGDGRQTRCFAHVRDVVRGLAGLLETPAVRGRAYNLGADQEISIQSLAERIRDRIDPSLEIAHVPYEKAYAPGFEDLRRRVPDLARIRQAIGFKPSRTLDDILDDVISHERSRGPVSEKQR